MKIVIGGAGGVGYYLGQLLIEEGHEVALIDQDPKVCEHAKKGLKAKVFCGNSTDFKILEQANVKNCNAFVALTSSDETNMVASLLAKEMGAKTVATRIEQVEYDESVLKKVGIDIVVHPKAAAAGYILELLTKPDVLDLVFISRGQAAIIETTAGERLAGKKVKELEHPQGSSIVAIVEGDNIIIPDAETTIKKGNKLLVLTKKEAIEQVRKNLC